MPALLISALLLFAETFTADESRGLTDDPSLLKGKPSVVVFFSAKCPVSNAYGERFEHAYQTFRGQGVRFLFVNSNQNEDAAEIGRNAKEHGFTFPIFRDTGSRAADRFGALGTPDVFILDAQAHVVYHGSFDDALNPARVRHHAVEDALRQLLAGVAVTVEPVHVTGCSIKRPRSAK